MLIDLSTEKTISWYSLQPAREEIFFWSSVYYFAVAISEKLLTLNHNIFSLKNHTGRIFDNNTHTSIPGHITVVPATRDPIMRDQLVELSYVTAPCPYQIVFYVHSTPRYETAPP